MLDTVGQVKDSEGRDKLSKSLSYLAIERSQEGAGGEGMEGGKVIQVLKWK